MTSHFIAGACRFGLSAALTCAFTALLFVPSSAGIRDKMKDKMVDGVADNMVATIQSDTCPEFAAMMQGKKGGDSDQSSKMKSDPATRQRFVDKVAGPLLNKMIDCDMVPSK